jgi:hypothetical protein
MIAKAIICLIIIKICSLGYEYFLEGLYNARAKKNKKDYNKAEDTKP